VWVDDPHFNLDYHVRHTGLPGGGGDLALRRLMGRLMSQPLDRDRPLWEAWVVEGLEDGRWAIISKVHHCMVDGISGVDLLSALLDLEPSAEPVVPSPWEPEPDPSSVGLVVDAWQGLAGELGRWAGRAVDVTRHPGGALDRARHLGAGLVEFGRHLGTTPPLSIEGSIGPHRTWAHSTVAFDDIRATRRALGGTVNDVVLTAVTGGYRRLLDHRGDDLDDAVVRTLVPVSVRGEARDTPDNRVSAILYELPIHELDPVARLARVRDEMGALKESHMAEAGEFVTGLGEIAPPMLLSTGTRLTTRLMRKLPQRSINTVTTNVPGPQFPLYCLGREMVAYLPFVPLSEGVRVGTAILSYNGTMSFGVTGDYDTAPDVAVLADAIADEVAVLRARAADADADADNPTTASPSA
jgi:WS/DGAT/MGAT family acyltransferase